MVLSVALLDQSPQDVSYDALAYATLETYKINFQRAIESTHVLIIKNESLVVNRIILRCPRVVTNRSLIVGCKSI
jgi:hypothetical protein